MGEHVAQSGGCGGLVNGGWGSLVVDDGPWHAVCGISAAAAEVKARRACLAWDPRFSVAAAPAALSLLARSSGRVRRNLPDRGVYRVTSPRPVSFQADLVGGEGNYGPRTALSTSSRPLPHLAHACMSNVDSSE